MRVLVTGHSGYIGSVLVPLLQSQGHVVQGMDIGLYDGCDLGPPPDPIPASAMDIRDVRPADLHGIQAVVHLAGLCNDPLGELNPEITDAVNARATERLAIAAATAGVERFVFSSTCSVYGFADSSRPVDESSGCHPLTAYARSKLVAETAVLRLANAHFTPVVLRSGSLFGPSRRLRTDLVVNNLTAAAWTARMVALETDGSPWRPLVDIQDVCATMARMLDAPRRLVFGEIFNVGSDAMNLQVAEIAQVVARQLPGTTIRLAQGAGPDERSYRASFGKLARAFPDLSMRADLGAGIRELVAAFARAPLRRHYLESGRYARLAVIRRRMGAHEVDGTLRRSRERLPA